MEELEIIPQNNFDDLGEIYRKIIDRNHKYIKLSKIDEIEWLSYINRNIQSYEGSITINDLNESDRNHPVQWINKQNKITITLKENKNRISISKERIDSPVLKGIWWGEVKDYTVDEKDELVKIALITTFNWPFLIKGGDPDPLSAYFLAIISLRLGNKVFYNKWLEYSSNLGQKSAIRSYSMILVNKKRYLEAVYWLAKSAYLNQDHICEYVLSILLLSGQGIEKNAPLAEFLLCRLCKIMPKALTKLGKLYYSGNTGVKIDKEQAYQLLRIAAEEYKDAAAQAILDNFQMNDEKYTSISDWILASAFIFGSALGLFYLFNHIKRMLFKNHVC